MQRLIDLGYMSEQVQLSKLYHCVYALYDHLVICTTDWRTCFDAPTLARDIAEARGTRRGGSLWEPNGEADRVHLLIFPPLNPDLSNFVNNLKTTRSRLLRKEFAAKLSRVSRKPAFWSRSCRIISCGGAPLSILKRDIERQDSPE